MINYKELLNKLNREEKEFVINLCKELDCHSFNAYCELGIYNELNEDEVELVDEIKDVELTDLGYIKGN